MVTNNVLEQNFPSLTHFSELKNEMAQLCSLRNFKEGDVILREGQFIKVIPLLINGLVKVSKEDDSAGEVLLYYIEAGESCVMSMTSLIKDGVSKVKAVIEEDAEILILPADGALKISRKYPEWNGFMYDLFSHKYEDLITVITTLTFSNKDSRLLNYLNKQAEIKGTNLIQKTHFEISLDLGSSREVISRLLKKLESEGKVELQHGKIKLL
jgi:CRP/FNR family transcriptional regulator